MLSNEDALNAVRKEWTMLHEKVWDVRKVRSKRKVIEEARRNKKVVQFGRVHALCHEKNEELPLGHPNRKFKGRVVFLGNNVVNQDYESAVFADLGNAPSSLESGRLVDAYGASEGCSSQTADAIQAYLQSEMQGDQCWITLPKEAEPGEVWGPQHYEATALKEIVELWKTIADPVMPMERALYGHPDSVTFWEEFCNKSTRKVGFKDLGHDWPSVFFHPELKLLLSIYVDDFKLPGPTGNLAKGWALLRIELQIGPESDTGMYLGCNVIKHEILLPDKMTARAVTYDMEFFLEQCMARYVQVAGGDVHFKEVKTPFLPDDPHNNSPLRNPTDKSGEVCPWCQYTKDGPGDKAPPKEDGETGALANTAASVLMKCMYAARMARFDLLRPVQGLARYISKWTRRMVPSHVLHILYTILESHGLGW
jgi:hypothetical protein